MERTKTEDPDELIQGEETFKEKRLKMIGEAARKADAVRRARALRISQNLLRAKQFRWSRGRKKIF